MRTVSRPPQLRGKIFKGTTAIRKGWLTRAQLRSTAWHRLFRDVYADSSLPDTHELRCLAVSSFFLPPGAVIAGRSASQLHGILAVEADNPVEVVSPRPSNPIKGVTIHLGTVDPAEVVMVRGIAVTSPLRTCTDLAVWLEDIEAVVYLDIFVKRQLVTVEQLREHAIDRPGQRGSRKLRQATDLVDPASESPQETRVRVWLRRAKLPRFVAQFVVRSNGKFLARVDFALPELLLAVEYDGAWHGSPAQLESDRQRLNRLVSAGWKVIHVTAGGMRDDFPEVISEIRAAIREQRRLVAQGKITASSTKMRRS